jgi:spermidine synthase
MPWTLIDTATEHDAVLELYCKDGMFMIRANGLELMNGFHHESESALGHHAAQVAPSRSPRILVGGLGLGYTIAALTEALGPGGVITVAELSGSVIDWFQRYVRPMVMPMAQANLRIVQADVMALLAAGDRYDVVALDVDNGPEPLVTESNAALYAPVGLAALHACLAEDGVALLWSGFESDAFAARAKSAGFTVTCEPIRRMRADLSHFIYVLAKNPGAGRGSRASIKN